MTKTMRPQRTIPPMKEPTSKRDTKELCLDSGGVVVEGLTVVDPPVGAAWVGVELGVMALVTLSGELTVVLLSDKGVGVGEGTGVDFVVVELGTVAGDTDVVFEAVWVVDGRTISQNSCQEHIFIQVRNKRF